MSANIISALMSLRFLQLTSLCVMSGSVHIVVQVVRQWSEMKLPFLHVVTLMLLYSSIKMRSRVLLDLCVGKRMCCLKTSVTIASLKLVASSSYRLLMCKLKSPVMTMLGSSTMLSVSHSVNSPKRSRLEPDGRLYTQTVVRVVWSILVFHLANWKVSSPCAIVAVL